MPLEPDARSSAGGMLARKLPRELAGTFLGLSGGAADGLEGAQWLKKLQRDSVASLKKQSPHGTIDFLCFFALTAPALVERQVFVKESL